MSTLSKYYSQNQDENPYTMEGFKNSSRVHLLKQLIEEHTPKGGKILDVGCGDMYLAQILPDYQWTGIDINTAVNNGKAIRHDIESTPYPFPQRNFDTIVCSEVLEHVFDPVKISREIKRLLSDTGVYLLSTPNFDFIDHFITHFREVKFDIHKSWTKEHIHCYDINSHDQILEEAGLKRFYYSGCEPHGGAFFQDARIVLNDFIFGNVEHLQDYNGNVKKDVIQQQTDILLGQMFKDWMHTILIAARKV